MFEEITPGKSRYINLAGVTAPVAETKQVFRPEAFSLRSRAYEPVVI
jgi:hypothetical protein